jgi:hypothetical protein
MPTPYSRFRPHPWHGLSPGPMPPAHVNAFIEITPFSTMKFEVDKVSGYLKVDRPQASASLPPTPYGFIPRTYCGARVAALAGTAVADNARAKNCAEVGEECGDGLCAAFSSGQTAGQHRLVAGVEQHQALAQDAANDGQDGANHLFFVDAFGQRLQNRVAPRLRVEDSQIAETWGRHDRDRSGILGEKSLMDSLAGKYFFGPTGKYFRRIN